jgi:hypothetical protein
MAMLLAIALVVGCIILGMRKQALKQRVKAIPKPYVDAGVRMTHSLRDSLRLPGWENSLPVYSVEEQEAMAKEAQHDQRLFNEAAGSEIKFHPEIAGEVYRHSAGRGLESLADRKWHLRDELSGFWIEPMDECPADWKDAASTYLKAWACNLSPTSLLGLGNLLIKAGYKSEAKQVLSVVALYPTYDSKNFTDIVQSADQILQSL